MKHTALEQRAETSEVRRGRAACQAALKHAEQLLLLYPVTQEAVSANVHTNSREKSCGLLKVSGSGSSGRRVLTQGTR